MTLVSLDDIIGMLTARIDALVADVLPMGRREGSEWVEAKRARGGLGDSLRVHLVGSKAGRWSHFASGARGDALELVSYVLFSGDKGKAVSWAKSWLGIDKDDPARIKQQRAKAAAMNKRREREAQEEREKKAGWAKRIWHNASPKLPGTPVDLYLLGRGIGIGDLSKPPGAIRYAPELKYKDGTLWPAMVAAIVNHKGDQVAVHRTFLKDHRNGVVTKAPVGEAKLTLGHWAGGFIPLSRGASGKPLKEAPAGDQVILCEGIEDGLSLALSCPSYRVLACINVGNFQNITLPETIAQVIIAADNDAETILVNGEERPHPARQAVQAAIDRFIKEGREVMITYSEIGKDFNDWLTHDAETGEMRQA